MMEFLMEHKEKLLSILGVMLVSGFVCAWYGRWNEIWYAFGQNLYHMFH